MIIDCSDIPGGDTKRVDGTTDLIMNWQDYKQGFGDLTPGYWIVNTSPYSDKPNEQFKDLHARCNTLIVEMLFVRRLKFIVMTFVVIGNDNLHKILSKKNYKLRIDLKDWNGDTAYAEYDTFVVGSEETNYVLSISGYNGNAGDSIINPPSGSVYQMNGMEFSTPDRDNDKHQFGNVAQQRRLGWWFNWGTDANLNGIYYTEGQTATDGIYWNSWQPSDYFLKSVSMKIKPV
ncbi:unnamed protein product [Mytilus edulis]|uniref:Fibrinogen C-terminal domain-containing protein n=1 Tax=Mytilus edulis TaxID=6550 RepID=A0A8S3QD76_MYTED|nr:unnamed protein product [Mytilus edulis]